MRSALTLALTLSLTRWAASISIQVLSLYGLRSSLETASRAHGGSAAAQGGRAQGGGGRGQGSGAGVQRGGGAAAQGGGVGAQGGGVAAQGGGGATAQGEQRRVCVALLSIQVRSSGGGRR